MNEIYHDVACRSVDKLFTRIYTARFPCAPLRAAPWAQDAATADVKVKKPVSLKKDNGPGEEGSHTERPGRLRADGNLLRNPPGRFPPGTFQLYAAQRREQVNLRRFGLLY